MLELLRAFLALGGEKLSKLSGLHATKGNGGKFACPMTLDAEATVKEFCAAWERRDIEAIMALLTDDVVYQNVPGPTFAGAKAARRFLAPIVRETTAIEFIIYATATTADGRSVLTERLDRLHYPAGVVDIPIMGIFVVRDGRISEWRDYSNGSPPGAGFKDIGVTVTLDPE